MAKEIRHHIRAWRKYRGYSLRTLAEQTGLAASTIGGLETGNSQYSQQSLEKIAAALHVSPSTLIGQPPQSLRLPAEVDIGQIEASVEMFKGEVLRAVSRSAEGLRRRLSKREAKP